MKIVNTGDKYGQMTILKEVSHIGKYKRRRFLCQCDCGKVKEVDLIHLTMGNTKSCGCYIPTLNKSRTRENSKTWKGGRYEDSGYVLVYHPERNKNKVYVREHILIMEAHIGRRLVKGEEVHHKNGVRNDNRLENLELWSTSHPPGQRVEDKIKWAKEILELYKNFQHGKN